MAKCEFCDKGVSFGIQVSHSHRRSNRVWKPNVKRVKVILDGSPKHVYVCTRCLRSGKVTRAVWQCMFHRNKACRFPAGFCSARTPNHDRNPMRFGIRQSAFFPTARKWYTDSNCGEYSGKIESYYTHILRRNSCAKKIWMDGIHMKNNQIWRYVFPALSVVLWIATIVLFFRGNRAYSTTDYEAQMQIASALRW